MGLIKEYVDRAVQTDAGHAPSPYVDPAVVLAAPPVTRPGLVHGPRSPAGSDSVYTFPHSPTSPMIAPLVSRRFLKRRHPRCPPNEIVNRRIVSMPETGSEPSPLLSHVGKRVVSMPDRVRQELEPSVELFPSPSAATGDSFGSCGGRREPIHVFRTPSDIPQTPSPPSSPESLLIIAAGTQFPDGFLRRRYSPEPLIEEDEDWITWASSPPRPIPALHGPLSLPYARCPSGAEGTIIEEPDNVAQMIWGLGSDDQSHQHRAESISAHAESSSYTHLHGPNQLPPRLQKKRSGPAIQVPKSSRTQVSAHMSRSKPIPVRTQRAAHTDGGKQSQVRVPSDIEANQDILGRLSWSEGHPMLPDIGAPDATLLNDEDLFPGFLEWQVARLRQALRTSLMDMDSYGVHPGRLEPVIPAPMEPGLSQSYPRIFVEPRPNDVIDSLPTEIAQQYRQQQLYRRVLQKQKLQAQNLLPTPPDSSSPQWSSQFSPCPPYSSTLSPESVGSCEHPFSISSQIHRSSTLPSQSLRSVYERQEHRHVGSVDTNLTAQIPQNTSTVGSIASVTRNSSSTTLAKYIKQLQALSPYEPGPPIDGHSSPLSFTNENPIGPLCGVFPSPGVSTPPSPQSPQPLSRGSLSHSARSIPPGRSMQRRLSSVPEEDSTLLELSTSVSPSRLQSQISTESITSSHHGTTGRQRRYHEVPCTDMTQKSANTSLSIFEGHSAAPSIVVHHETSPVKVRLPATKEHGTREQTSGDHQHGNEGHRYGHRKKHRYKKFKGLINTTQQAPTHRLVG